MSDRLRIAVAGASGFVGRALVRRLAQRHRVIALSRNVTDRSTAKDVELRRCDLFNLAAAERALEGADSPSTWCTRCFLLPG